MLVVYKKCRECGEKFIPKSARHDYHTRKCFVLAYKRKQREVTFPKWTCPECEKVTQLDFNPIKDTITWITYDCPHCKYSRLSESLELD